MADTAVYNDAEWGEVEDRTTRAEASLALENGEPLVFGGKGGRRGIRIRDGVPSLVSLRDGEDPVAAGVAVHDESHESPSYAFALASLSLGSSQVTSKTRSTTDKDARNYRPTLPLVRALDEMGAWTRDDVNLPPTPRELLRAPVGLPKKRDFASSRLRVRPVEKALSSNSPRTRAVCPRRTRPASAPG